MFILLIIIRMFCFVDENGSVRRKTVEGYIIAFIVYVVYDYIIKKRINEQIFYMHYS